MAKEPFGDRVAKSLFIEVIEAARLGALTLIREPRLSPPRAGLNLLSLKSEAFMSLGFGVLKIDLVSLNLALERCKEISSIFFSKFITNLYFKDIYNVNT